MLPFGSESEKQRNLKRKNVVKMNMKLHEGKRWKECDKRKRSVGWKRRSKRRRCCDK